MYAFGDAMLFFGLFGVSSLVPTAIALCFLRPYRRFWTALSGASVAFAALAVGAIVLFYVGKGDPKTALGMWVASSVLVILASPLLALAFAVCAVFSPHRSARIAFIASTFAEAAVFLAWFLPRFFLPY
jgi:hypothetical protein